MSSEPPEPAPRKYQLKPKVIEKINRPVGSGPDAPIDVRQILQANLRVEDRFAAPLEIRPRRSKRKRDYWTVLLGSYVVAALTVLWQPGSVIFVGAGVIILSLGLTWIMWFVMSDY